MNRGRKLVAQNKDSSSSRINVTQSSFSRVRQRINRQHSKPQPSSDKPKMISSLSSVGKVADISHTEHDNPDEPILKVFNSLTRHKDFFDVDNKTVRWYSCGPTVYDSAHMGHARTYISFDIIRRILEDYFGYNVIYCMNITDIDDKIIKRARERYLLEQYCSAEHQAHRIQDDLNTALKYAEKKLLIEDDPDKKIMREKMINEVKYGIMSLSQTKSPNIKQTWNREMLMSANFADVLSDWLDYTQGRHVTDNSIFIHLPRQYESEFHSDMRALNIRAPSILTRVSEYVPEIIDFIQKINRNGYAYPSPTASVYSALLNFS